MNSLAMSCRVCGYNFRESSSNPRTYTGLLLTKSFNGVLVVNNVSVNWASGKIHGLVGRNGSGKTVLLKCVYGLMLPSSGAISIGGLVLGRDIPAPANIGGIIENPGFLTNYSAFDKLQLLATIRGRTGKHQIRDSIKLVGLDPNSRQHVGKYSLGMKQRLGIAQAIMENPELIFWMSL